MVPTQEQIDSELKLIIKRLNSHGASKEQIKQFMHAPVTHLHNGTVLEYVYLGIGYMVLNMIDDAEEKFKWLLIT